MTRLRSLVTTDAGAAISEFALLAPVFLIFLFGTIEGGRLLWMQQTMETVAYSTARCMSVSSSCNAQAPAQAHGVARAAGYGIVIDPSDVTVQDNTTCRGFPASNRAVVTIQFASVMDDLVPVFPDEITAESCYPVLSSGS